MPLFHASLTCPSLFYPSRTPSRQRRRPGVESSAVRVQTTGTVPFAVAPPPPTSVLTSPPFYYPALLHQERNEGDQRRRRRHISHERRNEPLLFSSSKTTTPRCDGHPEANAAPPFPSENKPVEGPCSSSLRCILPPQSTPLTMPEILETSRTENRSGDQKWTSNGEAETKEVGDFQREASRSPKKEKKERVSPVDGDTKGPPCDHHDDPRREVRGVVVPPPLSPRSALQTTTSPSSPPLSFFPVVTIEIYLPFLISVSSTDETPTTLLASSSLSVFSSDTESNAKVAPLPSLPRHPPWTAPPSRAETKTPMRRHPTRVSPPFSSTPCPLHASSSHSFPPSSLPPLPPSSLSCLASTSQGHLLKFPLPPSSRPPEEEEEAQEETEVLENTDDLYALLFASFSHSEFPSSLFPFPLQEKDVPLWFSSSFPSSSPGNEKNTAIPVLACWTDAPSMPLFPFPSSFPSSSTLSSRYPCWNASSLPDPSSSFLCFSSLRDPHAMVPFSFSSFPPFCRTPFSRPSRVTMPFDGTSVDFPTHIAAFPAVHSGPPPRTREVWCHPGQRRSIRVVSQPRLLDATTNPLSPFHLLFPSTFPTIAKTPSPTVALRQGSVQFLQDIAQRVAIVSHVASWEGKDHHTTFSKGAPLPPPPPPPPPPPVILRGMTGSFSIAAAITGDDEEEENGAAFPSRMSFPDDDDDAHRATVKSAHDHWEVEGSGGAPLSSHCLLTHVRGGWPRQDMPPRGGDEDGRPPPPSFSLASFSSSSSPCASLRLYVSFSTLLQDSPFGLPTEAAASLSRYLQDDLLSALWKRQSIWPTDATDRYGKNRNPFHHTKKMALTHRTFPMTADVDEATGRRTARQLHEEEEEEEEEKSETNARPTASFRAPPCVPFWIAAFAHHQSIYVPLMHRLRSHAALQRYFHASSAPFCGGGEEEKERHHNNTARQVHDATNVAKEKTRPRRTRGKTVTGCRLSPSPLFSGVACDRPSLPPTETNGVSGGDGDDDHQKSEVPAFDATTTTKKVEQGRTETLWKTGTKKKEAERGERPSPSGWRWRWWEASALQQWPRWVPSQEESMNIIGSLHETALTLMMDLLQFVDHHGRASLRTTCPAASSDTAGHAPGETDASRTMAPCFSPSSSSSLAFPFSPLAAGATKETVSAHQKGKETQGRKGEEEDGSAFHMLFTLTQLTDAMFGHAKQDRLLSIFWHHLQSRMPSSYTTAGTASSSSSPPSGRCITGQRLHLSHLQRYHDVVQPFSSPVLLYRMLCLQIEEMEGRRRALRASYESSCRAGDEPYTALSSLSDGAAKKRMPPTTAASSQPSSSWWMPPSALPTPSSKRRSSASTVENRTTVIAFPFHDPTVEVEDIFVMTHAPAPSPRKEAHDTVVENSVTRVDRLHERKRMREEKTHAASDASQDANPTACAMTPDTLRQRTEQKMRQIDTEMTSLVAMKERLERIERAVVFPFAPPPPPPPPPPSSLSTEGTRRQDGVSASPWDDTTRQRESTSEHAFPFVHGAMQTARTPSSCAASLATLRTETSRCHSFSMFPSLLELIHYFALVWLQRLAPEVYQRIQERYASSQPGFHPEGRHAVGAVEDGTSSFRFTVLSWTHRVAHWRWWWKPPIRQPGAMRQRLPSRTSLGPASSRGWDGNAIVSLEENSVSEWSTTIDEKGVPDASLDVSSCALPSSGVVSLRSLPPHLPLSASITHMLSTLLVRFIVHGTAGMYRGASCSVIPPVRCGRSPCGGPFLSDHTKEAADARERMNSDPSFQSSPFSVAMPPCPSFLWSTDVLEGFVQDLHFLLQWLPMVASYLLGDLEMHHLWEVCLSRLLSAATTAESVSPTAAPLSGTTLPLSFSFSSLSGMAGHHTSPKDHPSSSSSSRDRHTESMAGVSSRVSVADVPSFPPCLLPRPPPSYEIPIPLHTEKDAHAMEHPTEKERHVNEAVSREREWVHRQRGFRYVSAVLLWLAMTRYAHPRLVLPAGCRATLTGAGSATPADHEEALIRQEHDERHHCHEENEMGDATPGVGKEKQRPLPQAQEAKGASTRGRGKAEGSPASPHSTAHSAMSRLPTITSDAPAAPTAEAVWQTSATSLHHGRPLPSVADWKEYVWTFFSLHHLSPPPFLLPGSTTATTPLPPPCPVPSIAVSSPLHTAAAYLTWIWCVLHQVERQHHQQEKKKKKEEKKRGRRRHRTRTPPLVSLPPTASASRGSHHREDHPWSLSGYPRRTASPAARSFPGSWENARERGRGGNGETRWHTRSQQTPRSCRCAVASLEAYENCSRGSWRSGNATRAAHPTWSLCSCYSFPEAGSSTTSSLPVRRREKRIRETTAEEERASSRRRRRAPLPPVPASAETTEAKEKKGQGDRLSCAGGGVASPLFFPSSGSAHACTTPIPSKDATERRKTKRQGSTIFSAASSASSLDSFSSFASTWRTTVFPSDPPWTDEKGDVPGRKIASPSTPAMATTAGERGSGTAVVPLSGPLPSQTCSVPQCREEERQESHSTHRHSRPRPSRAPSNVEDGNMEPKENAAKVSPFRDEEGTLTTFPLHKHQLRHFRLLLLCWLHDVYVLTASPSPSPSDPLRVSPTWKGASVEVPERVPTCGQARLIPPVDHADPALPPHTRPPTTDGMHHCHTASSSPDNLLLFSASSPLSSSVFSAAENCQVGEGEDASRVYDALTYYKAMEQIHLLPLYDAITTGMQAETVPTAPRQTVFASLSFSALPSHAMGMGIGQTAAVAPKPFSPVEKKTPHGDVRPMGGGSVSAASWRRWVESNWQRRRHDEGSSGYERDGSVASLPNAGKGMTDRKGDGTVKKENLGDDNPQMRTAPVLSPPGRSMAYAMAWEPWDLASYGSRPAVYGEDVWVRNYVMQEDATEEDEEEEKDIRRGSRDAHGKGKRKHEATEKKECQHITPSSFSPLSFSSSSSSSSSRLATNFLQSPPSLSLSLSPRSAALLSSPHSSSEWSEDRHPIRHATGSPRSRKPIKNAIERHPSKEQWETTARCSHSTSQQECGTPSQREAQEMLLTNTQNSLYTLHLEKEESSSVSDYSLPSPSEDIVFL